MKATLVLCCSLLAILSGATLIHGRFWNGNNNLGNGNGNSPRICVLENCNLFATNEVCARYGRSNLCKRFSNSCQVRYDTCVTSVTYTSVPISLCANIPVGTRRQCSSSSNAQAIVIGRRG
ncbi:hypothetical protein AWZ03_002610 [Drosophila navojoa]|uniref:Kazal-like domain-containing protein n=1 Tax=Drosophila navojoa TaxID=7232 RepID=A0A484BSW6_DRONA|nr:uncharacterized protein LOC108652784 [Drosophila navojoa]TDG50955.1 hypothetical protein AWZ03_002610 [Drosophila navojoa]